MSDEYQPRKSIARVALEQSEPVSEQAPTEDEERELRLLARVEQRLRAEVERKRPQPPRSTRPPAPIPTGTHWLVHLGTALTALGAAAAAIVTLVNALHKDPPQAACVTRQQLDEVVTKQRAVDEAQRRYEELFRSQVMGVWELQGVHAVDPPGSPPRLPLDLLPAPLVTQRKGSTKVPSAPLIQLSEPVPLPPPLP